MALDATIIDLCLSLFPWAQFRKNKEAIKLHTLLDLRGSIPTVLIVTHGKTHDENIINQLMIEAGAIYIKDRGYIDFTRLHAIHQASAFFIFGRLYSLPVDKTTDLQCEQIIITKNFYARKDYPEKLRRIRFFDKANNRRLVFLTNNFTLPALTIA